MLCPSVLIVQTDRQQLTAFHGAFTRHSRRSPYARVQLLSIVSKTRGLVPHNDRQNVCTLTRGYENLQRTPCDHQCRSAQ